MNILPEQQSYFKDNIVYLPIQEGLLRVEKKLSLIKKISHPLMSNLLEYVLNTPG